MATITTGARLAQEDLTLHYMTSSLLIHPVTITVHDTFQTQGQIGNSLAPRQDTSNAQFSWGN